MDLRQLVLLAFQVSIVGTVFGFGLKAGPDDLLYLVRRPGLLLRSLLAALIVMPILAGALARMFDFRPVAEIALMALAISPVPPLLPRREAKAGGQHSYGLALMIMLALLSIATVPLWLVVLERVSGRPLNASPTAIAGIVMKMAVLPLVAGIAVRAILPALTEKIVKPIALVANVLLPLAILALLFATWRAVWEAVGDGAVAAMVVFVTAGLIVGHLLGGPDREHSAVLALSSASRHPAIALSIAAANFPDLYFVGTILLYLIVNALVGLPYLVWQRRRIAAALV